MPQDANWTEVTPSAFEHERAALAFIREQFPTHEPWRAWSNFEFIATDGSLNEVDLLIFGKSGFFIIEIKNWHGEITGDAGTWHQKVGTRTYAKDNPIKLLNLKAKRLRGLLQQQRAAKKGPIPFIEPLIFLSAVDTDFQLTGEAAYKVCLRDLEEKPGIRAAIARRECPGLSQRAPNHNNLNRPTAKIVANCMEQAGLRKSQRQRRIGDYLLKELLEEGPGYQDWLGTHTAIPNDHRRVRLYPLSSSANEETRNSHLKAAEREYRLHQTLDHPGVMRATLFTQSELGPAILFDHHPDAIRLDHYLAAPPAPLTDDLRLSLLRQVAECIAFAHRKQIVHRGLSPQSIYLVNPNSASPRVKIANWQLGYRSSGEGSSAAVTHSITATYHLDAHATDGTRVYMGPELLADPSAQGPHHDIFSLGALAYRMFTGQAPAASPAELSEKLRDNLALSISSVLNHASVALEDLVRESTTAVIRNRMESVDDFLSGIDMVEEDLTTPDSYFAGDPAEAEKGQVIGDGYRITKRLGRGSTAVALLAEHDGQTVVLKIAGTDDHNSRILKEAEALKQAGPHDHIVGYLRTEQIQGRQVLVIKQAGSYTLRQRIQLHGPVGLDLLQRWGGDLLDVVDHLEQRGINHRDIKPDNIGIAETRPISQLRLVLFDFSLSGYDPEDVFAGTPPYLDPMLPLPGRKRVDPAADRYAAAMTLYEMATGSRPTWSDDGTPAFQLPDTAVIQLESEKFDPNLREQFTAFFHKAFARLVERRHDNASEMRRAWQQIFSGTVTNGMGTAHGDTDFDIDEVIASLPSDVKHSSPIASLGLPATVAAAMDRVNILTVKDLFSRSAMGRLRRLGGIGDRVRKAAYAIAGHLADLLGEPDQDAGKEDTAVNDSEMPDSRVPVELWSIDHLVAGLIPKRTKQRASTCDALAAYLGLDPEMATKATWPNQRQVAEHVDLTRGRISQMLVKARARWEKIGAITVLRNQMIEQLDTHGKVMTARELADTISNLRGSIETEPRRSQSAMALVRAAVELEGARQNPRFIIQREGRDDAARLILAKDSALAAYAVRLGDTADQISDEDPLLPPARVIDQLTAVPVPEDAEPLGEQRLLRLAVAASSRAALSSRQEIYPRGMAAVRALRLSQHALLGVGRGLSVQAIADRVASRYPAAEKLPGRTDLIRLLSEAGIDLIWSPDALEGAGGFVPAHSGVFTGSGERTVTTNRRTPSRADTYAGTPLGGMPTGSTTHELQATTFNQRLKTDGLQKGSFLVLTTTLGGYTQTIEQFRSQPDLADHIEIIDLEAVLVREMNQAIDAAGGKPDWSTLASAEQKGEGTEPWKKLLKFLNNKVMSGVRARLLEHPTKTLLLTNANWLGKYGQIPLLNDLRNKIEAGKIRGLWMLVPADFPNQRPTFQGEAIPINTNNEWAPVPRSWTANNHRAAR